MRQPVHTALLATLFAVGCTHKPAAGQPVTPGAQLYTKYCATCHGAEREGYKSDNAPSLRTTTFLASASDDFLRQAIARGRPGTAMAAYGHALGGPLTAADVDALVGFLRAGAPPRVALPFGPVHGDVESGKAIYASACVRCHGTPAQRSTAVHLANPILLQTASDAYLRYAVAEGRLPTAMVAWKNQLSAKQMDDVVAYVRSLAVTPAIPVRPAADQPGPAAAPRKGPVVINPRGRAPEFKLTEGLYVPMDQVKAALDAKRRMVIADARTPSEWLNLHIQGAISTPYYDHKSLDDIPKDGTWVIAYCACPHHVSGLVVEELRKRGYQHTAVLDEGIFGWQQRKYPIVAAPGMLPAPAPPPLTH